MLQARRAVPEGVAVTVHGVCLTRTLALDLYLTRGRSRALRGPQELPERHLTSGPLQPGLLAQAAIVRGPQVGHAHPIRLIPPVSYQVGLLREYLRTGLTDGRGHVSQRSLDLAGRLWCLQEQK